jgi:uncharacterized membrane protein
MDIDKATNVARHRAARSVWDRRGWRGVTIEERVGPWIVSLAGASLVVAGARQRSWRGVRWMVGGATLLSCAAAGLCNPRHAAVRLRHLARPSADRVTTELMDSFPASDAPSSSGMAAGAVLLWD